MDGGTGLEDGAGSVTATDADDCSVVTLSADVTVGGRPGWTGGAPFDFLHCVKRGELSAGATKDGRESVYWADGLSVAAEGPLRDTWDDRRDAAVDAGCCCRSDRSVPLDGVGAAEFSWFVRPIVSSISSSSDN